MLNQVKPSIAYPMLGEMKCWNTDPKEQGRRLRAVTTTYPGGADQLWLERWLPGEFDGWELNQRTEVPPAWVNNIELLRWDGTHLYLRDLEYELGWTEADKRKYSKHFRVRFDFETFGKKAEVIQGHYYDHKGEVVMEIPAA